MNAPAQDPAEHRFDWPLCHAAEDLVQQLVTAFLQHHSFTRQLARQMREQTATQLFDWIDHLVVSTDLESHLRDAGFTDDPFGENDIHGLPLHHPEALLPRIILRRSDSAPHIPQRLAIKVDAVSRFMEAHALSIEPAGEPLSRFRAIALPTENGCTLHVIERRAYRGYRPHPMTADSLKASLRATELWRTRPRHSPDEAAGYEQTLTLIDRLVALVGQDLACHFVFEGERRYWQARNRAAQIQKHRQDKLGLGWANHDHHTFRSSRTHFVSLIKAMEKLGFKRRERYHAGAEAGWGAQICEQPIENIVTFCDVDLSPEETSIDFSRMPLPPLANLGTIGLWVALHGESLLAAGMHHLECRFDYEELRRQLAACDVPSMPPFSDLPFLRQAFTDGEPWTVAPGRIQGLLQQNLISPDQAAQFTREGARGSHLENLQRKGGFKGFNQKGVSAVISATDPRWKDSCSHTR